MRKSVRQITARLEKSYGVPTVSSGDPLDELVLTILSQNTNDLNSDRAMRSLKQRFPTWDAVMRAKRNDVADAIRVGGLAQIKSERIQEILREIYQKTGRLSLNFLKKLSLSDAKAYLRSFKGVGPKTVACVLLFSCRKPAFPVDTHIRRIATRIGWLGNRIDDEKAHQIMERLVPPENYLSLHINLIRHGRTTCKAQNPKCDACCIAAYCDYDARSGNK